MLHGSKEADMARTVGLGIQDFEDLITKDYFYVDKTEIGRAHV